MEDIEVASAIVSCVVVTVSVVDVISSPPGRDTGAAAAAVVGLVWVDNTKACFKARATRIDHCELSITIPVTNKFCTMDLRACLGQDSIHRNKARTNSFC